MAAFPVRRVVRGFARAPIRVYRAGYGFVLGQRVLMLEHIGRRTGLRRYVVLEVVRRPAPDVVVVAAGLGRAADWYRNVERHPDVRVWIGRREAVPAVARPCEPAEARRHLEGYRREHPWTWRVLRPLIARLTGRPARDEDVIGALPLVELHLEP